MGVIYQDFPSLLCPRETTNPYGGATKKLISLPLAGYSSNVDCLLFVSLLLMGRSAFLGLISILQELVRSLTLCALFPPPPLFFCYDFLLVVVSASGGLSRREPGPARHEPSARHDHPARQPSRGPRVGDPADDAGGVGWSIGESWGFGRIAKGLGGHLVSYSSVCFNRSGVDAAATASCCFVCAVALHSRSSKSTLRLGCGRFCPPPRSPSRSCRTL